MEYSVIIQRERVKRGKWYERDDFILETGEEENWNLGYRGEESIRCPDLMT
jgi:hypothetical protein